MIRVFCLFALVLAACSVHAETVSSAPEYEGVLHNDVDAHRASIEANGKVYWLDFQGADLYHVAERYDRERVVVHGSAGFPTAESRPVIYVDSITFRPQGREMTYNVYPQATPRGERRIYSEYRRPAVQHRTIVHEYPQY